MATCPFADPAFCPGPDAPCPVCGRPGHAASWEEDMCVGDNEDQSNRRTAPMGELRQVLGAFYKTFDVIKSARNSESKNMSVWADDMKAVEDVVFFLENLRDSGGRAQCTLDSVLPRDLPADTIAAVVGGGVTSDQVVKIWGLIRAALLLRDMTGSSLTGVYVSSIPSTDGNTTTNGAK